MLKYINRHGTIMPEPNLTKIITDSLLFWTVIFYLAFLFHSWKIKELKEDIKSIEILFLSGALGYVFLKLSDYFIPIIDITKWLDYLKSLDPFGPSFMFNIYFAIILILIYYLLFILFTYIILRIIQFCVDPNQQILPKYHRFKILKKYKIKGLFGEGIPLILISLGAISYAIGGIMVFIPSIKFISLDFWPIIYLLAPIFSVIFLSIVLFAWCKMLYFIFKKYFLQFIQIILDKVNKFRPSHSQLENALNFNKKQMALLIFMWIYSTIIVLIKFKEGNLVLTVVWILLSLLFSIEFLVNKKRRKKEKQARQE